MELEGRKNALTEAIGVGEIKHAVTKNDISIQYFLAGTHMSASTVQLSWLICWSTLRRRICQLIMVRPTGFEPAAFRVGVIRPSNGKALRHRRFIGFVQIEPILRYPASHCNAMARRISHFPQIVVKQWPACAAYLCRQYGRAFFIWKKLYHFRIPERIRMGRRTDS